MSAASVLFAPGQRPDGAAIRALSETEEGFSISLDPLAEPGIGGGPGMQLNWLEIVATGLTFDLGGLAPGPSAERPAMRHAYGLSDNVDAQPFEAIALHPGPHLAGGRAMLPVVRCLAWLTARLALLPGAQAIAWHPARCWSAPQAFRAGVMRWIEGGAFPAFNLAAVANTADGALQSEGLALFTGQELRIEPELAEDRVAAAKIALRLLHWLAEHGTLVGAEQLTGPEGEDLRVEPSVNGRFVRVWTN